MVLVKLSVGRRSRPFWVLELMCRRFCYYCFLVMALHSDIPLSITTVIPFFTVCGAFRPLTDTDTGYFEGDSRKVVYHSITHGSSKAVKHISERHVSLRVTRPFSSGQSPFVRSCLSNAQCSCCSHLLCPLVTRSTIHHVNIMSV